MKITRLAADRHSWDDSPAADQLAGVWEEVGHAISDGDVDADEGKISKFIDALGSAFVY
jgi:hypothetical protein